MQQSADVGDGVDDRVVEAVLRRHGGRQGEGHSVRAPQRDSGVLYRVLPRHLAVPADVRAPGSLGRAVAAVAGMARPQADVMSGKGGHYRTMTADDWNHLVDVEKKRGDRLHSENDQLRRGLRDVRETINRVLEAR